MYRGSLSGRKAERMGEAFDEAGNENTRAGRPFGLTLAELNPDLGSLGRLLDRNQASNFSGLL
jgi:hypothetical protein